MFPQTPNIAPNITCLQPVRSLSPQVVFRVCPPSPPPPSHTCSPTHPCVCHQMPGSSGTTQSMKKTIGHRGVETTTGETTYKKVSVVGGRPGFRRPPLHGCGSKRVPKIFGVLKLVETFSRLLRIASRNRGERKRKKK